MKLDIDMPDELFRRLKYVAEQKNRDIGSVLQEALEQYLKEQPEYEFFTMLERSIEENKWLLDELAKR